MFKNKDLRNGMVLKCGEWINIYMGGDIYGVCAYLDSIKHLNHLYLIDDLKIKGTNYSTGKIEVYYIDEIYAGTEILHNKNAKPIWKRN